MSSEYPSMREPARARRKNRGRLLFGMGVALAVLLLLAALFGRIRLTALNDQAVELTATIHQQRQLCARLLIDHERIYDLCRVEEYAREELGMQRPRGDQLQFLEPELDDRVTLYPESGSGISLLDSIASCFQ